MARENRLELFGNLVKQETLQILDHSVDSDSLVLEAPEPFPGFFDYYSSRPLESKPLYVYLVTRKQYTFEQISRATQNIRYSFHHEFSATPGEIYFSNKEYHVIRVRDLRGYEIVPLLQASYSQNGIEFIKKTSAKIGGVAEIRLSKIFILDERLPGIYFDLEEENHGYFSIPRHLTWSQFVDITRRVKNNWTNPAFDAAIGHLHTNAGIIDMVRVYFPGMDTDYLVKVQKAYHEKF